MIDITEVDGITHRAWGMVSLTRSARIWCEDTLGYRPKEDMLNLGGSPENARWRTLVWFKNATDELFFRMFFARELQKPRSLA